MGTVLFRCPVKGLVVQRWVADEVSKQDAFVSIECTGCDLLHYVNPKTGKRLGEE